MGDRRQHPLESKSEVSILQSLPPSSAPSPGNNVTFNEANRRRDSSNSLNQQPTTTSQLRNRMDTKQLLTSDLNSSLAMNTSCASNSASAGAGAEGPINEPLRTLFKRNNTGPGGRSLHEEEDPQSWKTKISNTLHDLYHKHSFSLSLENKGSVARDHLANERTYLAWLRTSLSLISVGVAVTQLFRLHAQTATKPLTDVADMAKPLGGSFIALGILFLWLGTSRYFHSQSVLSYGQFPASRGSVIIATVTSLGVVLACFIVAVIQESS